MTDASPSPHFTSHTQLSYKLQHLTSFKFYSFHFTPVYNTPLSNQSWAAKTTQMKRLLATTPLTKLTPTTAILTMASPSCSQTVTMWKSQKSTNQATSNSAGFTKATTTSSPCVPQTPPPHLYKLIPYRSWAINPTASSSAHLEDGAKSSSTPSFPSASPTQSQMTTSPTKPMTPCKPSSQPSPPSSPAELCYKASA